MEQRRCPLDGKPCEVNCPDRYRDEPEGGCILTTALDLGADLYRLDGGRDTAIVFTPGKETQ